MRWTNLICATLLVVAALGVLIFLPGNLADYAREPEDVWLSEFWIGVFGLLAALCVANPWRSNRLSQLGWHMIAKVVVVVVLAVLLILGRDDPTLPPLLALCALGPVTALVGGAWLKMRAEQR